MIIEGFACVFGESPYFESIDSTQPAIHAERSSAYRPLESGRIVLAELIAATIYGDSAVNVP
jgi:hypothetical protein